MGEGFKFYACLCTLGEAELAMEKKKIKPFGSWVKVCELFNVIIACCLNHQTE